MARSAARAGALLLALAAYASAADLAFQRLALHQYEDGPVVASTYEYLPGEVGWFSARIAGYQREARGEDQGARLSWEVRLTDPAGVLIEPPQKGAINELLRREDRDWIPKISATFTVPSYAPRGEYKIAVSVKDEVANATLAGEMLLRVRGEELPPSGEFGIRNVRFLARAGDRFGMRPAVYQRPGTLFVQFDIVGYRMEATNRFSVEYQVALAASATEQAPEGAILYTQPEAHEESGSPFYPQRWVSGGFSLNFDADVPVGMYTLVITVRDKLGGQERVFREGFEIR
jgi:hypothetical protein